MLSVYGVSFGLSDMFNKFVMSIELWIRDEVWLLEWHNSVILIQIYYYYY